MAKRIVIVGSNIAGLTAALTLKERLGDEHRIVVVSKSDHFLFTPSLVWLPFGLRSYRNITFPLVPIYHDKGVEFHASPVTKIDLRARVVHTDISRHAYDYLVIATGPKLDYDAVPGLGPSDGFTESIYSLADAEHAREAFERFLESPGPVVVGAVQGAQGFGMAYEFALNMAHQLKRRGLEYKAPMTFVTPEPEAAHFGVGGFGRATKVITRLMHKAGIRVETNASVREILPDMIHLDDGRSFRFSYAMLAPPFVGVDAVRTCPQIVDEKGFVEVNDYYRTEAHPEVFAAGTAVALAAPVPTPVPCGVSTMGYLSERMGIVVANNVAAAVRGEPIAPRPLAEIDFKEVIDAGDTGIIMSTDHYLGPREHAWAIPGPEAHWAKLAFERYFLATHRQGNV
jgi:sulfide:quinone oxidoreductase